ncbi:MAG: dephospho-CoA kinase, partial [Jatrophihabitans sp.]
MRVGLTGGVGSGKSTVAGLLAEHGAVIVDADAIAREVVRAGTPGFDAVVVRFGHGVVGADGELDRAALATIVFGDERARADLNAIVHPLVGQRSAAVAAAAPPGAVVVHDIPLLDRKS